MDVGEIVWTMGCLSVLEITECEVGGSAGLVAIPTGLDTERDT